jgi:hypothetical protein
MAQEKFHVPSSAITPALYIGGGILAYFGVVKPLLEFTGLKKSKDKKKNQEAELKQPGWNYKFWALSLNAEKVTKSELMTNTTATQLASDLNWEINKSNFTFDIAVFKGLLKKINTQCQLSQVCYFYLVRFKKDMFTDFMDKLKEDNMTIINAAVAKLPMYHV